MEQMCSRDFSTFEQLWLISNKAIRSSFFLERNLKAFYRLPTNSVTLNELLQYLRIIIDELCGKQAAHDTRKCPRQKVRQVTK